MGTSPTIAVRKDASAHLAEADTGLMSNFPMQKEEVTDVPINRVHT